MKQEDIISGKAGLTGIQWALNGQSSRRGLRQAVQGMLRPGYRVGTLHLTRAKFKPERKLSAYFNFPALDTAGRSNHTVHLAITWRKNMDGKNDTSDLVPLQDEANRSGLMPVQLDLWRDFPEQGMGLQLWPLDTEFPQLVRLSEPSYAAKLFASLGIAECLQQLPVITPIRYRPKERHVLRYEICTPETAPGEQQRVYAKLYSSAQDAAKAFGIANRVVDWLDANPVGLQGNRPRAISEEDAVLFYPHAPGIPLSHQLHRSRRWLADQLQTIGKGLAVLHNGPETLQADLKQNNFSKEAKVVKRASEHIQALLPETYNKIVEIVEKAEEGYSHLSQEDPTFTHADFKSDHLLTTPEGLTLIDFDTCTLTDPALDLGKFLADLEWWFTLKDISGVEGAQAELLKGYVGEGGRDQKLDERLRRARFFHVLILVKIVARRVPIFQKDWGTRTSRLIEQAAHVLDETRRA
jgi:thiamine kinase-like enzyme